MQLAAEILACGNENYFRTVFDTGVIWDYQIIFAVRVVSTYFTFYKTMISKEYWEELGDGLPQKESIVIKRWPGGECPTDGLNIMEPSGRQKILEAFFKIRKHLLQERKD